MTTVLVITSLVEDSSDVRVVLAVPGVGVSPVKTIKGAAPWYQGNPYCVYGALVEEFTGKSRFHVNIVVADCRSGNLEVMLDDAC